jgi:transcription initiation factor IIE alpha subunit
LVWICSNQLGQLRIAGSELLENWLEHLRLLLNNLAELLELSIVSQKVEVTQIATLSSCCCSRCGSRLVPSTSSSATRTSTLSSKIEQIHATLIRGTLGGSSGLSWL